MAQWGSGPVGDVEVKVELPAGAGGTCHVDDGDDSARPVTVSPRFNIACLQGAIAPLIVLAFVIFAVRPQRG